MDHVVVLPSPGEPAPHGTLHTDDSAVTSGTAHPNGAPTTTLAPIAVGAPPTLVVDGAPPRSTGEPVVPGPPYDLPPPPPEGGAPSVAEQPNDRPRLIGGRPLDDALA